MSEDLKAQIYQVRRRREVVADQKEALDMRMRDWEIENEMLLTAQKEEKAALLVAENTLRELTLAAYQADPNNKKPAPGVGIKLIKQVEYDPIFALQWAKDQGVALKLDASAFEKAVLAFSEADRENLGLNEISNVWERPTATISKNLEEI